MQKICLLFIMLWLGYGLQAQNNALNFVGQYATATSDYVSVADHDVIDLTTNYTIEAWIKPSSFASEAGIVSKNAGTDGYSLCVGGGYPYSGLMFDGKYTSSGILAVGTWYHVVAVNDNGTRHLYLNGIEQTLYGTAVTPVANTNALNIGRNKTDNYFNGSIDEVRIWKKALTQTQAIANASAAINASDADLVAYYQFNQGTSGGTNSAVTTLTDASVNAKHGTLNGFELTGATSNFVDGFVKPANYNKILRSPSNVEVYESIGSTATFNITTNADWTITKDASATWLNVNKTSGTTYQDAITVTTTAANTTGSVRTAVLTLSVAPGTADDVTVTVVQLKAMPQSTTLTLPYLSLGNEVYDASTPTGITTEDSKTIVYKFTLATASAVGIDAFGKDMSLSGMLLNSPTIKINNVVSQTSGFPLRTSVLPAGTYYLLLSNSGSNGNFELSVTPIATGSNNIAYSAVDYSTTLAVGATTSGITDRLLVPSVNQEWSSYYSKGYSVALEQGKTYEIKTYGYPSMLSPLTDMNSLLNVYTGGTFANNTTDLLASGYGYSIGATITQTLVFTPAQTATYRLLVGNRSYSVQHNYSLTITESSRVAASATSVSLANFLNAAPALTYAADLLNVQTEMFGFEPTVLVDGESGFQSAGEKYYASAYKMVLTAGNKLIVDNISEVDAYLYIFKWNGTAYQQISSSDDGGFGHDSYISFTAPSDGTYYFVATTYSPLKKGEFTFQIRANTGTNEITSLIPSQTSVSYATSATDAAIKQQLANLTVAAKLASGMQVGKLVNSPVLWVINNNRTSATAVFSTPLYGCSFANGVGSVTVELKTASSSGINDNTNARVTVYANDKTIYVANAQAGDRVLIHDMMGRAIVNTLLSGDADEFPVPAQGIYMVNVNGAISKVYVK
jgi:hypothetical protein